MPWVAEDAVAAAQAAQSQPRIVALISGSGGTGTTATAVGLGLALARNRADKTVLVDAHSGTVSPGSALAQRIAPTIAEIARDPWGSSPLATPDGLYVVDPLPWGAPSDARDMSDALGVLTAAHAFVLVDVGNDVSVVADAALAAADQAVLVIRPGPGARPAADRALLRIAAGDPDRLDTLVIALVAPGAAPTTGAVVIPYDRHLAGRTFVAAHRLRPATTRAYLTLAAAVARPAPVHHPQPST